MKQREDKIAVGWKGLRKENMMGKKGDCNKHGRQKILLIISSMASSVGLALECK